MQIISVVLFVLGASIASALPTQTGGGCPGGYAEGAEIERGRLVYVCQGGQVVPKGCIAEDLSRIAVGANYDNQHYRRKCVAGSDNQLTFEATACVQNGQEHAVGSSWEDGTASYICKQNTGAEPALVAVNDGCVDAGKKVAKGEKIQKDDAVLLCQETVNGGSKLVQGGCVKNGKAFNAGDSFEDGKFWFNCTQIGSEKFAAKAAGCVNNGKHLNDGDRYFENDIIYECTIDNGKTDVRAAGCVQSEGGSTVERKLGCTWVEGAEPFQYEWQCVHDPATNTAKKVQVRCNYKVGGGFYQINPGCYRMVDKNAVGCSKEGETLKAQSFEGENAEKSASSAGLHAC